MAFSIDVSTSRRCRLRILHAGNGSASLFHVGQGAFPARLTAPPRKLSESSRPRTRLASVTVTCSHVQNRLGPGDAPADSGPTRSMPPASKRASDPPPGPAVWISSIGTPMGTSEITASEVS